MWPYVFAWAYIIIKSYLGRSNGCSSTLCIYDDSRGLDRQSLYAGYRRRKHLCVLVGMNERQLSFLHPQFIWKWHEAGPKAAVEQLICFSSTAPRHLNYTKLNEVLFHLSLFCYTTDRPHGELRHLLWRSLSDQQLRMCSYWYQQGK